MRTAILALILAVPVSLTADLIGLAIGEGNASEVPCIAPVHAVPEVMPPQVESDTPVPRPSRHHLRTA
ncbi:hypothetical protein [Thetidibacter halocola]|uniref:Uncharacterized protein n=1 Tax=Thetidibacter halocola TaxID=2827239 RepID=A0A8J7WD73_9RHOB|nr:hypothetical protein [Thetidibacter halocola]MBS0123531.1 hypothetical protein [Thetidibacter halocola]